MVIGDEVGKISGRGISTGLMLIGALIMFLAAAGAQATRTAELTKCALYYIVVLTFSSMATAVLCLLVFRVEASKENLSNGWDIANIETKRDIQEQLECCGFNRVDDRVTLPPALKACEPELEAKVDSRMEYMKVVAFLLLAFEVIVDFDLLLINEETKAECPSLHRNQLRDIGSIGLTNKISRSIRCRPTSKSR